ncbi:MAG: flavodoxin domain-containing protein [Patescibacteria group bacterium]
MKLLIVYASNSGSTYLTSKIIENELKTANFDITCLKAVDVNVQNINSFDLILVGSPSWKVNDAEGQPHETISEFLDSLKKVKLNEKKVAFFGCGDTSYLHFCGAVDILEDFFKKANCVQIVPSLKIDGYYFDQTNNEAKAAAWATVLAEEISN